MERETEKFERPMDLSHRYIIDRSFLPSFLPSFFPLIPPRSRFFFQLANRERVGARGKLEDPREELAGELDLHTSTGLDRVGSS